MIVVTGATGQLGRLIVEKLLDRGPADRIGVSVRNPDKAGDLSARGVRVRRGDFADRASLDEAFAGAEQVLVVSSNARATGGDPLAQHRTAFDAARAAGVRRIVYTSHMGVSATSAFPPMHDHAATEAMLAEGGVAWTSLRNGFYAGSGVQLMSDVATTGEVRAPADGPVSWTAHADLAEAAAIVLTEGGFDGPTPPLTAGTAHDLADMAAMASDALGRPVRRELISEDDLSAAMKARGAPDGAVAMLIGLHRAAAAGEFAAVDPTLERLLGRPPVALRERIAEKLG